MLSGNLYVRSAIFTAGSMNALWYPLDPKVYWVTGSLGILRALP